MTIFMSYLNRSKYLLIGLQIIICLGLAFDGISQYHEKREQVVSLEKRVVKAVLFIFPNDKNKYEDPIPISLSIAKVWINLLLLYGAFRGMLLVARNEYNKLLTGYSSKHTVLIGLNQTSKLFALDFLLQYPNEKLIVVARQEDSCLAQLLQKKGARVIVASLADETLWDFLNLFRLRRIIIFTTNDELNLELANAVFNRLKSRIGGDFDRLASRKYPFEMLTHLANPFISVVASKSPIFKIRNQGYGGRMFNTTNMLARSLILFSPPDLSPEYKFDQAPRFLIIGGGDLARALVLEIARHCHYPSLQPPEIVWVASDAFELLKSVRFEVPTIKQFCKISARQVNPSQVSDNFYRMLENGSPFTQVLLTLESEVDNFSLAKHIGRALESDRTPILLVLKPTADTLLLPVNSFKSDQSTLNIKNPVHYYSLAETALNAESILNERLDQHAKSIHTAYVSEETSKGAKLGDWDSLVNWDELNETYRGASRAQADHLLVKLRAIGMNVRDTSQIRLADLDFYLQQLKSSPALLERLAEMEHNRWNADRWLSGWQFDQIRSNNLKHHNNLVPYSRLSELDKQKDRDTFLNIDLTLRAIDVVVSH
jgi:hypothetical protein